MASQNDMLENVMLGRYLDLNYTQEKLVPGPPTVMHIYPHAVPEVRAWSPAPPFKFEGEIQASHGAVSGLSLPRQSPLHRYKLSQRTGKCHSLPCQFSIRERDDSQLRGERTDRR